jgi:hypothetical protein
VADVFERESCRELFGRQQLVILLKRPH